MHIYTFMLSCDEPLQLKSKRSSINISSVVERQQIEVPLKYIMKSLGQTTTIFRVVLILLVVFFSRGHSSSSNEVTEGLELGPSSSRFPMAMPLYHICIFSCDSCYEFPWKLQCANECNKNEGKMRYIKMKYMYCPYFNIY